MVVYGHVIDLSNLESLNTVYRIIYSFHMPLFFLISGYCIGMKKSYGEGKLLPELKKVFTKLIVPYLVWSAIYIFLSDKLTSPMHHTATLTLRGLAPLWFLATLAMCEIRFFAIAKAIKKCKPAGQYIILGVIAAASIIIGFTLRILAEKYDFSTETMTMAGYFIFIAIGRLFISLPSYILGFIISKTQLIYKFRKIPAFFVGALFITAVSFIVFLGNLKVNCHLFTTNHYWLFTLTSVLGALGIMLISYSVEKIGFGLSYLGQNSLGLMILHYVPFKTVKYSSVFVSVIWDNEIFISLAATAVATAVTMGAIYLVKKKFFIYK